MKLVIIGIIVGLSVLAIGIWFLVLSNTQYEIIEKETIHPCQQISLDFIDEYNKLPSFVVLKSAPLQELEMYDEEYSEFLKNGFEKFKQNIIKYNCQDIMSEWYTTEFVGKLKFFTDYNFLP